MASLIDSHCHLCDRQFDKDCDETIKRARDVGVVALVNVGTDVASSKKALGQAANTPGMYATAGLHPHRAKEWTDSVAKAMHSLLDKPEVIASGEMGLDFFRNLSERDEQLQAFEAQLSLAAETGLPAIIHDRDAHQETLEVLSQYASRGVRGVVHCFTGDWSVAQKVLDLGFYLGLTGLATYRSTAELTEVAKHLPLERLLVETDCPYLTPQKHRKKWKRNEPSLLPAVAGFIAEARGERIEAIAEQTTRNACELFSIALADATGGPQTSGAPQASSRSALQFHTLEGVELRRDAGSRADGSSGSAGEAGGDTAATGDRGAARGRSQRRGIDDRTKKLLELPKVVDALAERAATDLGTERCRKLTPSTDPRVVRERLSETSEARAVIEEGRRVPFGGIRDIRDALREAGIGAVLAPMDLLAVASTLGGLRGLRSALTATSEAPCPRLRRLADGILLLPELETEIERCIDPEGEVRDNASEKLRKVRRRIASLDREAHRKIETLIANSQVQKHLQEPLATVRGDRLCVPVRAESRSHFPGLVHDQSASGQTLFIEPAEVVDLGNQLRQAHFEEREEIHRILAEFTRHVAKHQEELGDSLRAASILDFIFAKARLSIDWHCSLPQLVGAPQCDLVAARHPLLGDAAVPVDVSLGDGFSVLLLTGPNTGGKTVTLKTVGLLCLMTECGLHIPARHNSKVHLFSQFCVDIGDEQSIEQSLSTFSSHMTNIVEFVREADRDTLVLLDEIGVGTDPDEGAALAKAILRRLKRNGARVIATTHYSELKNFAFAETGVENACVEFDPETLRPTYRIVTGLAGSSNAFFISSRLGLPGDLVEEARESMAQQKEATAELIESMEALQRELDHETTVAQREREEAERLRQERERALAEAREKSEGTRDEAVAAAGELLTSARTEAEGILRELRNQTREGKPTQQAMDRIKQLERELAAPEEPEDEVDLGQFQPGRRVRVSRLRRDGVVLTKPTDAGKVSVRTDTATVEVFAADLELLPDEEKREEPKFLTNLRLTKTHVPQELSLLGQTVDEAVPDIDKYLDDAAVAGLPSVRLIHGKGTGALRKGVHEFLRQHPMVERFELADLKQGGDGATVAYLARV